MVIVERTTYIDADRDKVAEYLGPDHLTEIWPGMIEVSDVTKLPNGGVKYHYQFKLAGFRIEGDSETIEFDSGGEIYRRVQKNTGHVDSTISWMLIRDNGSTTVKVKAEYEIPDFMLSKLAEPLIRRLNEREADAMLWNLKDRVESAVSMEQT